MFSPTWLEMNMSAVNSGQLQDSSSYTWADEVIFLEKGSCSWSSSTSTMVFARNASQNF